MNLEMPSRCPSGKLELAAEYRSLGGREGLTGDRSVGAVV